MKRLFQIGLMVLLIVALEFISYPAHRVDRDVGGVTYALDVPDMMVVSPVFTAEPAVITERASVSTINIQFSQPESMVQSLATFMTMYDIVELSESNIDFMEQTVHNQSGHIAVMRGYCSYIGDTLFPDGDNVQT